MSYRRVGVCSPFRFRWLTIRLSVLGAGFLVLFLSLLACVAGPLPKSAAPDKNIQPFPGLQELAVHVQQHYPPQQYLIGIGFRKGCY